MYVELHARSAFSFLEGAALPEALAERAARLGQPALALLDRDGLYGAPRLYPAAVRLGGGPRGGGGGGGRRRGGGPARRAPGPSASCPSTAAAACTWSCSGTLRGSRRRATSGCAPRP